jgi:methenyltetrahydrofolate cyclohydrolase
MYTDKPLGEFLADLSSRTPTPGGGSAAALSGAMGAALVCMVCNLTIGKEKYKSVEAEMQAIEAKASQLRDDLLGQIAADINAYGGVAAASKLPRVTDEEKAARSAALQQSLKKATAPPLEIARLCAEVMDLCLPVGAKGNVSAVSDAGVGIAVAEAGLCSAALNVKINLGLIKDPAFVAEAKRTLDGYLEGKASLRAEVLRLVEAKL